ncbi:MAG TPA: twin-arginine translocase subunit TatC [Solirubrobacteraceae bacterium]|jgi:sec-independent protein translocase protein TatC|nr:twin-arginine translocase subunit TatC [Solirubrobacteraceae bacterium]
MATAIRTVGHEQRLSIVDHLDELRTRLIVSACALAVVFGVCVWQNHALLKFVNRPLTQQTRQQVERFEGPLGQTWLAQKSAREVAEQSEAVAATLASSQSGLPAATRARLAASAARLRRQAAAIPTAPPGIAPTTLGPGEPLTATLTVSLYFAVVFSLPLILFELYGFVLPAFTPSERRLVLPLLLAVPFLFAAGVAFGYLVVLPAAVRFLQNFNSSQFNVLVQASQYYKFAATILLAMGVCFQAPVAILGAVHAGLITPRTLRRNRRYAIIVCAAVAALLPGDLFTMLLETVPLYLLYEASILIATVLAHVERGREESSPGAGDELAAATPTTVQQMIDHTDPDLN